MTIGLFRRLGDRKMLHSRRVFVLALFTLFLSTVALDHVHSIAIPDLGFGSRYKIANELVSSSQELIHSLTRQRMPLAARPFDVQFNIAAYMKSSFATTSCSRIAFTTDFGTVISVMNGDGTDPIRLPNSSGYSYAPSISPDGNKIVFVSNPGGHPDLDEIYIMNADGTGRTRLTNNTKQDLGPSFSPDGSKIAFASYMDSSLLEIYVINVDGTGLTRLTNNSVFDGTPSFSPDGTKIVFFSSRTGSNQIHIMDADGTDQIRLTNNSRGDTQPVFSPDGSKIAFASFHDNRYDLYLMNADGTGETRLTNNPDGATANHPSFSPDGSKIAFAFYSDPSATLVEIYTMNIDGTNQTNLTNNSVWDQDPSWGVCSTGTPPPPEADCTVDVNGGGDYTTIHAAVNDTNCTVIEVAPGTYYENNISFDREITINGAGARSTVVDGGGVFPVFYFIGPNSGSVTLSNMSITNGAKSAAQSFPSGGINNFARLTLNNVTMSGNRGGFSGGAIYSFDGSSLTIKNSTFSGNTVDNGFGGAVRIDGDGAVTIYNSTFFGNGFDAGLGGASHGGAIFASRSFTVVNSTFAENMAVNSGSAITVSSGATATIKNTIITENTSCCGATQCSTFGSTILDGGHNLDSGTSCGFSVANGSLSNANAHLGPFQNNGGPTDTMALLTGSQAINAADNAVCAAAPISNLDQRGVTRPQNCACDIGAFEFEEAVVESPCRVPAIFWSPPANITYGTALDDIQLNAMAGAAGSFTYTPAAGSVLSVGTHTLSAVFTPTDTINYNSANVSVSLTVLKATPPISWNNPADIVYGTPLSDSQLNATSPVAGSFTYSPLSGTLLSAFEGQFLTAFFTPDDADSYSTAEASVQINVQKAPTSTALSSSVSGQVVTLTAAVTSGGGTPPGSVEFFDGTSSLGSSPLSGGSATLSSSALSSGSHTITASYVESLNFLTSTSPPLSLSGAATTSTGANVTVPVTIGTTTISTTFSSILSGGTTTVVPTDPASVGTLPGGFELFGGSLAFDISTTAQVSPPITVCFQVPSITDATQFANLRVLHSVGNLDLVAANSGSTNASVRLGNGLGGFGALANFGAGNMPSSVAVGDFNKDDSSDIAVANQNSNNVSILLSNGAGVFSGPTNLAVGTSPRSVAIADFNGDGNLDLAVANASTNNVSILLGTGTGSFGAATNYSVAAFSPRAVAVGDFNLDGKPDLVTANDGSNSVSVLLRTTNGSSFGAATNYNVGTNPRAVAVGDFNRDGRPDLAVANVGSDNVSIRLGNGSGGFTNPGSVSVGTDPVSVAVGNIDSDSFPDLIVVNQASASVSVRLGNGNGTFDSPPSVPTGTSPRAAVLVDFNGDNIPDLAVANGTSNNLSVRLGNGSGGFGTATNLATGTTPVSVAVGNFNKDTRVIDQTILSGPNAPNFTTKTICASVSSFSQVVLAQKVPPTYADLAINKSDGHGNVLLGDNVTYTINVENRGPDDAKSVTITDTLPATVNFGSAPGCAYDSVTRKVTCAIGVLPKYTQITRTIIAQTTVAGELTNRATVSTSSIDSNLGNNTDDSETEVVTLQSLSFSPASVTGGCQTSAGTVRLNDAAPAGGLTINLNSNGSSAVVPASVIIPADRDSANFVITSTRVSTTQTPVITATLNTALGPVNVNKSLSILPVGVGSLTLNPSTVTGGNNVTGTVNLVCPAAVDTVVTLSSSNESAAKPALSSITILSGQTTKTFTIKTFRVWSTRTAKIKATANGISKEATLTIRP